MTSHSRWIFIKTMTIEKAFTKQSHAIANPLEWLKNSFTDYYRLTGSTRTHSPAYTHMGLNRLTLPTDITGYNDTMRTLRLIVSLRDFATNRVVCFSYFFFSRFCLNTIWSDRSFIELFCTLFHYAFVASCTKPRSYALDRKKMISFSERQIWTRSISRWNNVCVRVDWRGRWMTEILRLFFAKKLLAWIDYLSYYRTLI